MENFEHQRNPSLVLSLPSVSLSLCLARSFARSRSLSLLSLSLCPCPLRRRKGWQGASLLRQEESEHTVSQLSLAILHYVLYAVFWHKRVYYKAIHSNIVRAKRDGGQRIWLNPGEARGRSGGRSCRHTVSTGGYTPYMSFLELLKLNGYTPLVSRHVIS